MGCGNSQGRVQPVYYDHEAVPDPVSASVPINLSQYQLRMHVLDGRNFRYLNAAQCSSTKTGKNRKARASNNNGRAKRPAGKKHGEHTASADNSATGAVKAGTCCLYAVVRSGLTEHSGACAPYVEQRAGSGGADTHATGGNNANQASSTIIAASAAGERKKLSKAANGTLAVAAASGAGHALAHAPPGPPLDQLAVGNKAHAEIRDNRVVRWNQKWALDPFDPEYDAVWILIRKQKEGSTCKAGTGGVKSKSATKDAQSGKSIITKNNAIATAISAGDADDASAFDDVGQVMISMRSICTGIVNGPDGVHFKRWYKLSRRVPTTEQGNRLVAQPVPGRHGGGAVIGDEAETHNGQSGGAAANEELGEVLIDFGWIRRSQNLVSLQPDYDADGIDRNLPFAALIPGPAYSYYVIDYFPMLRVSMDTRHPPYAENMLVMSDQSGWIRFDVDDVICRRQRRGTVRPRNTAFHISMLCEVRCPGPGKLVFVVKGEKVSALQAPVLHYHIYSGQVAEIIRDLRTIAHSFGFFRSYPFRLHVPRSVLVERPVRPLDEDPNTRTLYTEPDGGWARIFKAFLCRYERDNSVLRNEAMYAIHQMCDRVQESDIKYTSFARMSEPSFNPECSFEEHRVPVGTLALHRYPTFLEPSSLDALAHALKYNCFVRELQFYGPVTSSITDVDEAVRRGPTSLRAPLYLQQCMKTSDRADIPGGVLRMDDEYLMFPEWWSGAMWALGEAVSCNMLHTVSLRHVRLGEHFAYSLASAAPHRKIPASLTHLDVAGNFSLAERGLEALIESLQHVLLIRHLDISGTCTTGKVPCLQNLLSINLHAMSFLGLNDMMLDASCVINIAKSAPMLRTLLIARTELDLAILIPELADVTVSLTELDISDGKFAAPAVSRICELVSSHPSLCTLVAAGFPEPVKLLNALPDGHDGREFTLRIPRACWSHADSLSHFAGSLTSLDVSYSPALSADQASSAHKVLFAIFGASEHKVTSLSLRAALSSVSSSLLTRYLADTLSKSNLTALDISVPFAEDMRGPHFAPWPADNPLQGVQSLQIGRCDRHEILWRVIATNASLKYLDITNQAYPDVAMAGLGRALGQNSTLTAVYMEGNYIGPLAAAALQDALLHNKTVVDMPLFLSSRLFLSADKCRMAVTGCALADSEADYEAKRMYERMIGNIVADVERNRRMAEAERTARARANAEDMKASRRAWQDFKSRQARDVIGALRQAMPHIYRGDPKCYAQLRKVLDAMGPVKNATEVVVYDVCFALNRSIAAKHIVSRLFSAMLTYIGITDVDRVVASETMREAVAMWRNGGKRGEDGSIPADVKTISRLSGHDSSDVCRWHGHWWWFDDCYYKHHWHVGGRGSKRGLPAVAGGTTVVPKRNPRRNLRRRSMSRARNPALAQPVEGEVDVVERFVDEWLDNVDVLAADELGAYVGDLQTVEGADGSAIGVRSNQVDLVVEETNRLTMGAKKNGATVKSSSSPNKNSSPSGQRHEFGDPCLFSAAIEEVGGDGPSGGWDTVRFEPFVYTEAELQALEAVQTVASTSIGDMESKGSTAGTAPVSPSPANDPYAS